MLNIKKSILCFLIIICLSENASAYGFGDSWRDFVSPINTKASPYFYTGAALTSIAAILEDQLVDPTQEEITHDKPLGRTSVIGDLAGQMVPNAIYFVGMGLHYWITDSRSSGHNASHMFRATFYSSLLTTILKYSIREPRPNSSNRDSFPSGHTTTAFAFAGVILTEHGWFLGTLAIALASFTAVSRMNDNRHFLHDVLGGTTIGLSYALGTYFVDKKRGSIPDDFFVNLAPLDSDGMKISARMSF